MDVESLAKQLILKGMTEEQQKAILESIKTTMGNARAVQKQRIGENVQMVVQALKKIEADIKSRYDETGKAIEKRVASIKDGQDGRDGTNGKDGRAGRDGSPGATGPRGANGLDGKDGRDGENGVSVTDAHIDFDGSLIISLSSGRTINVGEVIAPDVAEKIKVITNGGGTSQTVIDALASLQTQINNLIPSQTGNAGKFLTTNGSVLSWADVAGGLDYQGTWNASTNTPTLVSSTGTNGYYYVVSVDGSTNLNGVTDWKAGDWVIFNGSVWQKIDQSWAIAGANDNITSMTGVTGGISSPDFIQFDTTATVTDATGRLYYNDDDQFQTLAFQMNGSVIQHIGEEIFYRVRLSAAATKGQVLMFTGTLGASGGLTAAPATGLTFDQSNYLLGIAGESGSTNDWITVYEFGEVKGVNTSAFTQGQILYYDPTVTGGLTATKPNTPNAISTIAAVVHVGVSNGVLFVRPTFGSALGGTDGNVRFGTLASGNTVIYDAVDGVWKNANLTASTGISVTNGAGSITITNSAPDQTVALTAGTGISTSGTYPNFTITNSAPDQTVSLTASTGISTSGTYPSFTITNTAPDQTVALTAGTGISTSGTYPNFTITNSAPDQTVALTGAGTTSITGTYPNFTITSNDQYVGTVTSVTGTSPVASSGGTTPAISLASGYGDTQNPYASKTANYVLAAPNGSSGAPTFRAIVAADIPTLNQNTTGTASNVTGTVAIANGGTGQTTATAAFDALSPLTTKGDLIAYDGTDGVRLPVGTNGYVLTADSTAASGVAWAAGGGGGGGVTASNDTSTSTNLYPLFAAATTGTLTTIYTSNPNYLYKPSTGELSVTAPRASNGILVNSATVSANYTIASGDNGVSAGPVTVASGITVTVSSGSVWTVT